MVCSAPGASHGTPCSWTPARRKRGQSVEGRSLEQVPEFRRASTWQTSCGNATKHIVFLTPAVSGCAALSSLYRGVGAVQPRAFFVNVCFCFCSMLASLGRSLLSLPESLAGVLARDLRKAAAVRSNFDSPLASSPNRLKLALCVGTALIRQAHTNA